MTEMMCQVPLVRSTEFIVDNQGVRLFGTCGPDALASAASSALGRVVSCLEVYNLMLAHGWCDASGASTIDGLRQAALALGCQIAAYRGYGEPWPDWQAWLEAQVSAGNPCVTETANGQALVDTISGDGENAVNLQYHYIAELGRNTGGTSTRTTSTLPAGFWCADGDNFAGGNNNANHFNAANVLQYYSDAVLGAAQLCAGLALVGRPIQMAWTKMTDGRGLDAQGHICGTGFMIELLATGDAVHDGLMGETYLPDKTSFLPLSNGNVYTYDGNVHTNQGAEIAVKLYDLYEAALKQAATAPVVPVTPAPAPLSTSDQLAIEAVAAIKAALAA